MIATENLTKIFRTEEVETTALREVDLSIEDGEFVGINPTSVPTVGDGKEGLIPIENSVWVTRGKEDAFGDWLGQGRLVTGYGPWWDGTFLGALYLRHCERAIDPALIVYHPAGYRKDPDKPDEKGTPWSTKAREVGQALRSGATVTLPSTTYVSEVDGRPTTIRLWDVDTKLSELANVDAFEAVLTRKDADTLLGLLIPPAAISTQYAKETLGGKSMTEILGNLAQTMLYLEWVNLANCAEDWIFDDLVRWNFGEGRPRAQLVTDGFKDEDVEGLRKVVGVLLARGEAYADMVAELLDLRQLIVQSGLPVKEEERGTVVEEGEGARGENGEESPPLEATRPAASGEADANSLVERARHVAATESEDALDALGLGGWEITREDLEMLRAEWEDIPELGG